MSNSRLISVSAFVCSLFFGAALAEEVVRPIPSPDRQWEYRVIDDMPVIVKAGTTEVAVQLPAGDGEPDSFGKFIWAPDSRRFAFNHRASLREYNCVAYEIVGAEWKQLPDFAENGDAVQEAITRAMAQQIKRRGLPADTHQRRIGDTWRARRWIDNNTLELFAYSAANVENEPVSGGILFRVRCDGRGNWKIVFQRSVAESKAEKLLSD